MLRSALDVTAERTGLHTAVLRVVPRDVGHAVPTGDPFRRLRLELSLAEGDAWAPLEERSLQRVIDFDRGFGNGRVETADSRVGAIDDRTAHSFDLTGAAHSFIRWRVVYERLDHPFGAEEPDVFERVLLREGFIAPPTRP